MHKKSTNNLYIVVKNIRSFFSITTPCKSNKCQKQMYIQGCRNETI